MQKVNILEIRYGWGFTNVPNDQTERTFAFVQDVLKPEPRIPFPPNYFDVLRFNLLEPYDLNERKTIILKNEIERYLPWVKEDGKVEVYGIDSEAEAYLFRFVSGEEAKHRVKEWGRRNISLNPLYVEEVFRNLGFEGPSIENRHTFPCFSVTGYRKPINWIVTDWDSLDNLRGNYIIPAKDRANEDWNSFLSEGQSDESVTMPPRKTETSCLFSALCKPGQEDILFLILERLKNEKFDEYIILIDKIWKLGLEETSFFIDFFEIIYRFYEQTQNTTVILSDDVSGICRAWNRLFKASRGEYLFVNSSDVLIYPGHKEKLLKELKANHSIAWITSRPNDPVGRCHAYSSCFRAAPLFSVGLLSPEFNPCSCDDNDIAMKLVTAGYKICASPDVIVSHLGKKGTGTCDEYHQITEDFNFMMNRQITRYWRKWENHKELAEKNFNLYGGVPWSTELKEEE